MTLKPTGTMGDFVHETQTMALKEGFSCVSRKWWEQTHDYDWLEEFLTKSEDGREDIFATPKDMKPFLDLDKSVVGLEFNDGRKFELTEHAWCQLASRGDTPTGFVKHYLNPEVRKQGFSYDRDIMDLKVFYNVILNNHRRMKDQPYLFRVRSLDNKWTCRAVLTEQYATVNNLWYFDVLKMYIPNGRISHFYGDEDTLRCNVLIPDSCRSENDSDYGGMISCGNSEIGTGAIYQYPSVFRAICMNGCIWDQSKGNTIKQVHKGEIDYDKLQRMIRKNIHDSIPLLTTGVDLLLESQGWKLTEGVEMRQVLFKWATENQVSPKNIVAMYSAFNQHEKQYNDCAFGLINTITRVGQSVDRNSWDKMGGSLLIKGRSKWESLCNRAKDVTIEDIQGKLKGLVA